MCFSQVHFVKNLRLENGIIKLSALPEYFPEWCLSQASFSFSSFCPLLEAKKDLNVKEERDFSSGQEVSPHLKSGHFSSRGKTGKAKILPKGCHIVNRKRVLIWKPVLSEERPKFYHRVAILLIGRESSFENRLFFFQRQNRKGQIFFLRVAISLN